MYAFPDSVAVIGNIRIRYNNGNAYHSRNGGRYIGDLLNNRMVDHKSRK